MRRLWEKVWDWSLLPDSVIQCRACVRIILGNRTTHTCYIRKCWRATFYRRDRQLYRVYIGPLCYGHDAWPTWINLCNSLTFRRLALWAHLVGVSLVSSTAFHDSRLTCRKVKKKKKNRAVYAALDPCESTSDIDMATPLSLLFWIRT